MARACRLGIEARHDLFGIHAELNHFKGHSSAHRFLLLGHKHDTTPAFADLL
jgi:hypothetical protein